MGVEIEKKYRLTRDEQERLKGRLLEIGAQSHGEEFEENVLYAGNNLDVYRSVLRLRRTQTTATLTYKERFASDSAIKHQREDETRIEDAAAMHTILDALGYRPALVYEKRRATWRLMNAEIVVDELPFGFFVEIEGDEKTISEVERILNLSHAEAEHATYPQLAAQFGKKENDRIEARFEN